MKLPVAVGATSTVPDAAEPVEKLPAPAPDVKAVQDVALVDAQVSVTAWPSLMLAAADGLMKDAVGIGGGLP